MNRKLAMIAAVSENNVIGRDGSLPWHLPRDLRWFKETTMGHHLIMGRKTFESFGSKPLKGREIIVVSRSGGVDREGVRWARSLDEALEVVEGDEEPFIGGGESLFRDGFEIASRMYLTRVHAEVDGDTYFPDFDESEWIEVFTEYHEADARNELPFTFSIYERAT
ncbi:MAG: dihydrofolate reductase [Thermoanaerobaculia bacterium]|nr:dihydrofolate reductase [Thermoanaerobaculia bacterium]